MFKKPGGLIAACVGIALIVLCAAGEQARSKKIKIGVPDDSAGLLIHYIIHEKQFQGAEVVRQFEMYPIRDCCTTTSEWALSTDALDMAVMCPDAARILLEKDPRYKILGPCLLNSDMIVTKPGIRPKKIAVTRKRGYQEKLVRERFGADTAAIPMLSSAIPFAYEKNAVNGAVIDVLKGLRLDGEKHSVSDGFSDVVTYMLVIRKSFAENPLFNEFMKVYKQSVEELEYPDVLQQALRQYKNRSFSKYEIMQWKQMRVKFVFPSNARP